MKVFAAVWQINISSESFHLHCCSTNVKNLVETCFTLVFLLLFFYSSFFTRDRWGSDKSSTCFAQKKTEIFLLNIEPATPLLKPLSLNCRSPNIKEDEKRCPNQPLGQMKYPLTWLDLNPPKKNTKKRCPNEKRCPNHPPPDVLTHLAKWNVPPQDW